MKTTRRWHSCSLWFVWRRSVMLGRTGGGAVGEGYHMTRCGWDSQLCWGCIRHECATEGLNNNDDDFVLGFIVLFCSWQMEGHSPSRSVLLHVGSRHTMKNCRFPETLGELWCGKKATLIMGPFIERIKVRMTETDCSHAHHYDVHSQTYRCNVMLTFSCLYTYICWINI